MTTQPSRHSIVRTAMSRRLRVPRAPQHTRTARQGIAAVAARVLTLASHARYGRPRGREPVPGELQRGGRGATRGLLRGAHGLRGLPAVVVAGKAHAGPRAPARRA